MSNPPAPGSDWRAFDLFEFARASRSAAGTLAVGDLPRMVNEVRAVRGLAQTNESRNEPGPAGRADGASVGAANASLDEALRETISWKARGESRAKTGGAAELYLHLSIEVS